MNRKDILFASQLTHGDPAPNGMLIIVCFIYNRKVKTIQEQCTKMNHNTILRNMLLCSGYIIIIFVREKKRDVHARKDRHTHITNKS